MHERWIDILNERRESMLKWLVLAAVIAATAWFVQQMLPDIRRNLKLLSM
jgi:hypothetical protein